MRYIGQTGRPFRTRYQEQLRDFKYNYKSKFAQHLLEKQHAIDKMENIMNVLHITDKGQMMNTIGWYYIYRVTKMVNQINGKLTVQPKAIFESIVRHDTHRGLQAAHDPETCLQNQPWEAVHVVKRTDKCDAQHKKLRQAKRTNTRTSPQTTKQ